MPPTPDLALPYPAPTDPPDGPAQLQQLAERLEAILVPRLITTGLQAGPGYSVLQWHAAVTGWGQAMIYLMVTRTGGTLRPDPNGNIEGEPIIATLPDDLHPAWTHNAVTGDGRGSGEVVLFTNGNVHLRSWTPGGAITQGQHLRVTATLYTA